MTTRDELTARNVASIATLPLELLARIISFVGESPSGMRQVVYCSHVCRYWREVALAFPEVWATIWHDGDKNKTELLRLAIERAGNAPIDLTLSLCPEYPRITADMGPQYAISRSIDLQEALVQLACIVEISRRIRTLDMTLDGFWPYDDAAHLFSQLSLSALENLCCSGGYPPLPECPRLRSAEFIEIVPIIERTSFPSLQKLVLKKVDVQEHWLRSALRCLPCLNTLELWSVNLVDAGYAPPSHVRLPAKLYFHGMTPEDILTLLTNVESGAEDVTSYAPLRAWNYFARIYDVLAFHVLSDITHVTVRRTGHTNIDDGPPSILTFMDRDGRRRAMTIPAHVEGIWKTLATRMNIFDTVEHWDLCLEDLFAIRKHNSVFTGAVTAKFDTHISGTASITPTSWPSLRKAVIVYGKSDGFDYRYNSSRLELAIKLINSLTAPELECVQLQGIRVSAREWASYSTKVAPSIRIEFV